MIESWLEVEMLYFAACQMIESWLDVEMLNFAACQMKDNHDSTIESGHFLISFFYLT